MFTKHDQDKVDMSLIPSTMLEGVGRVLMHGEEKYGRDNWRQGCEWSRYVSAAMRHIAAFNEGQDWDEESGLSHLCHAICCLTFLYDMQVEGYGEDNRFKSSADGGELSPLERFCKSGQSASWLED